MKRTLHSFFYIFLSMPGLCAATTLNWPATILPWSQASQIPPIPSLNFQRIQELRNAGHLQEAKEDAETYLQEYPNDVDVMLLLGLMYLQENNPEQAEPYLKRVLSEVPTYMDARVGLVRIRLMQKKYGQALHLIKEGLQQQPEQRELLHYQLLINRSEFTLPQIAAVTSLRNQKPAESIDILKEIKELRAQGKIKEAEEKARSFLAKQQDVDVTLMLGLLEMQQQHFKDAAIHLEQVLQKVPTYLDARVALIKIKLLAKEYPQAKKLLADGFHLSAQNSQLLKLASDLQSLEKQSTQKLQRRVQPEDPILQTANQLLAQKKYAAAQSFLQQTVAAQPHNSHYRLLLAEAYFKQYNDLEALLLVKQSLHEFPTDLPLYLKKGEINYTMRAYAAAAKAYQTALQLDANNKPAKGGLEEVKAISPFFTYGLNEVGLSSDNTYVQDLHSVWDYSTLYYNRDGDFGHVAVKLNFASRLQQEARQYELDVSPRVNRDIYFDFSAAYSSNPALFPNFLASGEGYINLYDIVEVSGGSKFAKIASTYLTTYTGSLNFYPFNFWLSFRPYYFVPKDISSRSILYSLRIRRYFATIDHYLSFGVGAGRSPDLADLLTVNFLVIRNNFINAGYTFPIINHHIVIDLSAGYQRWQYPSQLIRRLYDGSIGFRYRF